MALFFAAAPQDVAYKQALKDMFKKMNLSDYVFSNPIQVEKLLNDLTGYLVTRTEETEYALGIEKDLKGYVESVNFSRLTLQILSTNRYQAQFSSLPHSWASFNWVGVLEHYTLCKEIL
jgi:hypothetical protein